MKIALRPCQSPRVNDETTSSINANGEFIGPAIGKLCNTHEKELKLSPSTYE